MGRPDSPDGAEVRGGADLAALAALARDPRLLRDPGFLGALHAKVEAVLGPDEAAATLVQAGWIQGLRDATRALRLGFADRDGGPHALPAPPSLAMDLAPAAPDSEPGALLVRGVWPERSEARSRAAAMGPGAEGGCPLSAGYTSGWLSGLFETELLAVETSCAGRGDPACAFTAREPAAWRRADAEGAGALLRDLDLGDLRAAALRDLEGAPPETRAERDGDRAAPVVHVWGPVMVIPHCGADASLQAVQLVRRDASTAGVRVVVLDLGGVALDDTYGALAVERILEAAQAAGAEAVLCGVSPLGAPVVDSLEGGPALVEKDLAQAVATAFRIADAQQRGV